MDEKRPTKTILADQTAGADLHGDSVTPKDLRVKIAERRLAILWRDGNESDYSLGELRRRCPCATCRTERERQDAEPLMVLKSDPAHIRMVHAEFVGNYAIRFRWSDGHDAGIFDFRFLRSLDPPGAPPSTPPESRQ